MSLSFISFQHSSFPQDLLLIKLVHIEISLCCLTLNSSDSVGSSIQSSSSVPGFPVSVFLLKLAFDAHRGVGFLEPVLLRDVPSCLRGHSVVHPGVSLTRSCSKSSRSFQLLLNIWSQPLVHFPISKSGLFPEEIVLPHNLSVRSN